MPAFSEKKRPKRPRLSNLSSELLMLILHLRATEDYGDEEQLREKIKESFVTWENKCRKAQIDFQDVETAKFALVAFLDETIITSNWVQREAWIANPFQMELYGRFDAGQEFFKRLGELRQRPKSHAEVLEIYYLCMAMGFEGEYQLHDKDKLRWHIEDTYNDLRPLIGNPSGVLAPHGRPRDEIVEAVKRDIPPWVIGVISGGVCIFIYLVLSFLISNKAESVKNLLNGAV